MTLLHSAWLPVLIITFFFFVVFLYRTEKKFFEWVRLYWFYRRSKLSIASSLFFILSFLCFAVALLDIRGPEVKINMELPEQKTIILMDASASMLVEDVRPNRFKRGIFLARHFVRSAVGHQVSVILFSDLTKRVVSFTSDIDLLDARLTGLEKMDITSGGSNISGAVHEAVRYFHEGQGKGALAGNIVLITDGEENVSGLEKALPAGVNLAVVGIGTTQGGFIPMRSQDGTFRGYRRYSGENVVSKLNEDWFKNFAKNHQNFKYWVAQSYTVPTEEVLDFFATIYDKRMSEGEVRYRPVWGFPLIMAGLLCLMISSLLSVRATFIKVSLVLIFTLNPLFVQHVLAKNDTQEVVGPVMSEQTEILLRSHKEGNLNGDHRFKLAEHLYKDGFNLEAINLYREIFKGANKKNYPESWKNYAFLLLQEKMHSEAGLELSKIFMQTKKEEDLKELRTNVILILQQQGQEGGEGEGEDQSEEQEQDEDSSGESDQKDNQGDGSNKEDEQSKEDQQDQEDQEQQNPEEQQSENESPQTWDDKVKDIKQQQRTKDQIPAVLQQLMDADREVQQDQLDTRTSDPSSGTEKDW